MADLVTPAMFLAIPVIPVPAYRADVIAQIKTPTFGDGLRPLQHRGSVSGSPGGHLLQVR